MSRAHKAKHRRARRQGRRTRLRRHDREEKFRIGGPSDRRRRRKYAGGQGLTTTKGARPAIVLERAAPPARRIGQRIPPDQATALHQLADRLRRSQEPAMPADPNPFPRFHVLWRARPSGILI